MKLTKRKIDAFIRDEREATREYKKYGLGKLSRSESSHLAYLKKVKKNV